MNGTDVKSCTDCAHWNGGCILIRDFTRWEGRLTAQAKREGATEEGLIQAGKAAEWHDQSNVIDMLGRRQGDTPCPGGFHSDDLREQTHQTAQFEATLKASPDLDSSRDHER